MARSQPCKIRGKNIPERVNNYCTSLEEWAWQDCGMTASHCAWNIVSPRWTVETSEWTKTRPPKSCEQGKGLDILCAVKSFGRVQAWECCMSSFPPLPGVLTHHAGLTYFTFWVAFVSLDTKSCYFPVTLNSVSPWTFFSPCLLCGPASLDNIHDVDFLASDCI